MLQINYQMQNPKIRKIAVINGSLRKDSSNYSLIRIIESVKPNNIQMIHLAIDDIPLMNQDLEEILDGGATIKLPEPVNRIRDIVRECEGLLVTSPQYNGGVTGPLKNAYDWLSRDYTHHGSNNNSNTVGTKKLGVVGASYVNEDAINDAIRMVQYLKLSVFTDTFYTKLGKNFAEGKLANADEQRRLLKWAESFFNWVGSN